MTFVECDGFVMQIFAVGRGNETDGLSFCDGGFNGLATFFAEFLAGRKAAFKNFDAVIGVGIVRGGNVNGEVEAHFKKAVIDGWSGENADGRVFDTERL